MESTYVFILALLSGVAGSEVCTDVHPSSSTQNKRYTGDVLTSVSVVGLQQCRTMCRHRRDCRGINYNRRQLSCQLMSNSTSYNPNLLTSDSEYTFYPDTEHESEAEVPQTCQKKTCPENQVCVTLTSGQLSCQEVPEGDLCKAAGFTYLAAVKMCIVIEHVVASWPSGETLCNNRHGRLVILNTAEKFASIGGLLQDNTDYWVGATRDVADTNLWSWTTLERVSPPPNANTGHEMCMLASKSEFKDNPCPWQVKYICEFYYTDI